MEKKALQPPDDKLLIVLIPVPAPIKFHNSDTARIIDTLFQCGLTMEVTFPDDIGLDCHRTLALIDEAACGILNAHPDGPLWHGSTITNIPTPAFLDRPWVIALPISNKNSLLRLWDKPKEALWQLTLSNLIELSKATKVVNHLGPRHVLFLGESDSAGILLSSLISLAPVVRISGRINPSSDTPHLCWADLKLLPTVLGRVNTGCLPLCSGQGPSTPPPVIRGRRGRNNSSVCEEVLPFVLSDSSIRLTIFLASGQPAPSIQYESRSSIFESHTFTRPIPCH